MAPATVPHAMTPLSRGEKEVVAHLRILLLVVVVVVMMMMMMRSLLGNNCVRACRFSFRAR